MENSERKEMGGQRKIKYWKMKTKPKGKKDKITRQDMCKSLKGKKEMKTHFLLLFLFFFIIIDDGL